MGNGAFAVSAAFDALVACAFVAWGVRYRPSLVQRALAATAAVALLAAKGILLIDLGLSTHFGVLHVLWLDAVVVVPVAAALLGALVWRAGGPAVRTLVVAGLLAAPVGAYASFVEPERLVVERTPVALSGERAGSGLVRVAILADIQFEHLGDHEREAVALLLMQRPDVILLTGDYNQAAPALFERQLPAMRRLFARLRAPGGVFAVQGDVEGIPRLRRLFAGTGVRVLVNELARTRVGDRRLTIGGIQRSYWDPDARAFMRAFERLRGMRDVRILVAHRPDAVRHLRRGTRVDLVASGHTHGGQLQLPLIGPLTIASGLPREVGAGGLHELDGRRVYVSRGVGVERGQAPRLRLGAPPEISLITLR